MATEHMANRRCDGVTRREILRAGGLAALGLSLTDLFRLRAAAGDTVKKKAKSCILLWLDGGPSHLETFDLKPDAPAEVRGPFKPIATKVPGVGICEWMPRTAEMFDKVAVIRSMTSPLGEHNLGAHYMLTGYKPTPVLPYPSYGAVVAQTRERGGSLPPYVAIPDYNPAGGAGYLSSSSQPFAVGGDPSKPDFRVRDLDLYPGVTPSRLERRQSFRAALDEFSALAEKSEAGRGDPHFDQAQRLLSSTEAKRAFDLDREKREVRDRYGRRMIGQSCLLARRLVEAGVPFVTVTDRGWDTHDNLVNRLKEGYTGGTVGKIPVLDQAFSALVEDLKQRGMLDETLIVVMGEFGRTPKLNTIGGRDHWPRAFSVALAGGGVKGGTVVGASDSRGEGPADRPVTPEDLACTIYTLLGISPRHEFHTRDGRPVPVNQNGKPIEELFA